MADAEGVLLELAWRALGRVRVARPYRSPRAGKPGPIELTDLRTELDVFLCALFGRRFELVPIDPPRRSTLARLCVGSAPWSLVPEAMPATDGRSLYLPRTPGSRGRARVMALVLAARVQRGSLSAAPADPLARDLYWCADGAHASTWLCQVLPGLATELAAARSWDRAARSCWRRPSSLEQRAEAFARAVLAHADPGVPAPVEALASWARETAVAWRRELGGTYRGIQPVTHWGVQTELHVPWLAGTSRSAVRKERLPARTLRAAPGSLPPDSREPPRPGPWLVPPGDPQLSVAPARRISRPLDAKPDEDLGTLASELERAGHIPRIRSDHAVHEVLESDAMSASVEPPARARIRLPAGAAARYPEWDCRARAYLPDWCWVRETAASEGDRAWVERVLAAHRPLVRELRAQAERLRPRLEYRPRQLQGPELDLEACVEHHADRLAGAPPSDRLYRSERRLRRDCAVSLLLDSSASTDRWLEGSRRVIDVVKEAALLFCDGTSPLGDRHALYAFASRGALGVRVPCLKRFDESYGAPVQRRIAGLEPADRTRLGAALRHVTRDLAREPARIRLLLLLSDGRPSDDDGYDGLYGVEDTRRAVHEAARRGIRVFCLSVDPQPGHRLSRIFGSTGHAQLLAPYPLAHRLTDVYRRLTS